MNTVRDVLQNSSHHAYLLEGEKDFIVPEICRLLEEEWGITLNGNPDFYQNITESFGIDDGRKIKELASRKAIREKKIFIIAFQFITREAQN